MTVGERIKQYVDDISNENAILVSQEILKKILNYKHVFFKQ